MKKRIRERLIAASIIIGLWVLGYGVWGLFRMIVEAH